MSGLWFSSSPSDSTGGRARRFRRGAALTLVFASVLGTGAATGSWGDTFNATAGASQDGPAPTGAALNESAHTGRSSDRGATGAGERAGHGSAPDAAEELVSRSGDRWSGAYTPREYEGLRQTLDGEYVGVGISVRQESPPPVAQDEAERAHALRGGAPGGPDRPSEPLVTVAHVHPGSPADKAGIRSGDRLRAIDGQDVAGRPITEVVGKLRGAAHGSGSDVRLRLSRGEREWTSALRRKRLAADTVDVSRLGPAATRIKVSSFTRGTGAQVRKAVREDVPEGAGIVLDLRGNSGGLVDEAVDAASAFLDGGLVATYDDKGTQRALYAQHGGDHRRPLVVLVDGGTMSAAELLTGALRDRGRAVTVGSRTFGKGSVQLPSRQPDGSVAELTVGHYATPSGRRIDDRGLVPDLSVGSGGDGEATERARTVLSGLATRS
ncbi:S41 family peptidase [Streptomyces sp. ODS28]|uniref:S41 family peptidase n=1 Tax=Streptomyces sp. ODS28 TaxID=3136688 RepID=UPI0031F12D4A